jgi:hypothetical protein
MSLADVRPFFKARAKALSYSEHTEAFSSEALAKNSGKKFFIKLGTPQAEPNQHSSVGFRVPVVVDLYMGTSRQTIDLEDRALEAAQAFVSNVGSNRFSSGINGIYARSVEIVPLDGSNDNAVIARVNFEALVEVDF